MHIESFDSMDDMFARMAEAEAQAMAALDAPRRALIANRKFWWVRPAIEEIGAYIFGAYDFDAFVAKEREGWDPEDGPFEDWLAQFTVNNLERGYKTGRAYSHFEPEGELGDTHVAHMLKISEKAFEEAKAVKWELPTLIEGCPTLKAEIIAYIESEDE